MQSEVLAHSCNEVRFSFTRSSFLSTIISFRFLFANLLVINYQIMSSDEVELSLAFDMCAGAVAEEDGATSPKNSFEKDLEITLGKEFIEKNGGLSVAGKLAVRFLNFNYNY